MQRNLLGSWGKIWKFLSSLLKEQIAFMQLNKLPPAKMLQGMDKTRGNKADTFRDFCDTCQVLQKLYKVMIILPSYILSSSSELAWLHSTFYNYRLVEPFLRACSSDGSSQFIPYWKGSGSRCQSSSTVTRRHSYSQFVQQSFSSLPYGISAYTQYFSHSTLGKQIHRRDGVKSV